MSNCPTEDLGTPQITSGSPDIVLSVGDIIVNSGLIKYFEWSSFVNGGYSCRIRLNDPQWSVLNEITKTYLNNSRREPTKLTWYITWGQNSRIRTEKRVGFLIDLSASGFPPVGSLEFIAIDPPSYWLSAGNCDGSVYVGNISNVIKQVINDYAPGINIDISDTKDYAKGRWHMMRQDPYTFIRSLLDFSSKLTNKRTNWLIAASDFDLSIKEQAEIEPCWYGAFNVNLKTPSANDVIYFHFLGDNYLTTTQTKLLTSGISAVSGYYLDKSSDTGENYVHVKDERTENKRNTTIGPDFGYNKPKDELNKDDKAGSASGATYIMSVPEHNAGDVGVKYQDYIDGRARNTYLRMMSMLNRLMVRVHGYHHLHDSTKLGTSFLSLNWQDANTDNFFLAKDWMIYGWVHVVTPGTWNTDIYLNRLDYNAIANKIPRPNNNLTGGALPLEI